MSETVTMHATSQELSLWIDGELSPGRVQQVEAHVDDCLDCRRRYLSTLELVENLRALEKVAPPSTLGMVVERHRLEVGNRKLRQRLEQSWHRWPDPMILTYLGVVVALGVMAVLVSRIDVPETGTVIRAPAEVAERNGILDGSRADVWVEPGISDDEASAARAATDAEARAVLSRLEAVRPPEAHLVIARHDGEVVRVEVGSGEEGLGIRD